MVQWRDWYGSHLDHIKTRTNSQGWNPGEACARERLIGNIGFMLALPWEMMAHKWEARFPSVCVWDEAVRKEPETQAATEIARG